MSRLQLIQCGVGGFGGMWLRDISSKSPDFELVALVDVSPKALAEAAVVAGLTPNQCFSSLEAALQKVHADAVLTVTPPPVHVQHARVAFARGLHLMTEKPLADTIENARLMVKLARDAGKQLLVSQNYRYRKSIQKLRQMIAEKLAGELGHGHLDFYIPADFTGTFREKMDYPLLVDMAIHHFDLIRCVTGRNIRKITALSFRPGWSWYAHEPALKALMQLDDGVTFSYSGDWTAIGKVTNWNGNWRLQCGNGSLHMEDDQLNVARCERWCKNPTVEPIVAPELERFDQHHTLHAFAQSIRTNTPAETNGQDNLWSFGAVMAGVLSAKENRTVDVRELIES